MAYIDFSGLSLPITNPVLQFFIILFVILTTPILFNKLKIPHILGLIIAGAIIGPNGFNILLRDTSIVLLGTAGLLYIMFLAGLELDLAEFKKNSSKSLIFGLYTFSVPMILGTVTGLYILNYSMLTSVLLASMFASHTLIAYPILSKLGVIKNRAVNVAVGGTMITDTLSLLVLAVIVGMATGEVNTKFWVGLSLSLMLFGVVVIFIFPLITRLFLKYYSDSVSQYIFVLVMVFLGAVLAELAGIEGIIGAFLTGLALNQLIPGNSPLMNRIEFIGNSIFIPFFLFGVGMLVDYRAFFKGTETIMVAGVMTVVAILGKFIPAWLAQKSFGYTKDERKIIFGLSNAQAAATLAAVLVGYNVILGETAAGEPIRLLNDSVLNGTIIMILVTCTIASFAAQKGGENISLKESSNIAGADNDGAEKILIPVLNPDNIEELVNFCTIIKSKSNKKGLFALNIVNDEMGKESDIKVRSKLEKAVISASSKGLQLNKLLRYDINTSNGITGVIKEQNITDLILGLHIQKDISESFLGKLTEGVLAKCNTTTFVYKPIHPISSIKRHIVVIPKNAEKEIGFPFWLSKVWNIANNTGSSLIFYASEPTITIIKNIRSNHPVDADFKVFDKWDEFLIISRDIKANDNLIIVLSREHKTSYHDNMRNIPSYIDRYFQSNSIILIYPMQIGVSDNRSYNLNDASLPINELNIIKRGITKLFHRN